MTSKPTFYKYITPWDNNPMERQEVMVRHGDNYCLMLVNFGDNTDKIEIGRAYADSYGSDQIKEELDQVKAFKAILDEGYEKYYEVCEEQLASAKKREAEYAAEQARLEKEQEEEAAKLERPNDGTEVREGVRDPMLTKRDPDWRYDEEAGGHQEPGDDAKTQGE